MNIIEFLNQIWTQILDVTALFVTPDWGFLISMLPVMVLFGLVMPFLTGDELAVICPMCGLGRMALIDTCTNCGLVLKVKTRAVAVRTTAGPKPGGAAAA